MTDPTHAPMTDTPAVLIAKALVAKLDTDIQYNEGPDGLFYASALITRRERDLLRSLPELCRDLDQLMEKLERIDALLTAANTRDLDELEAWRDEP